MTCTVLHTNEILQVSMLGLVLNNILIALTAKNRIKFG